MTRHQRGHPPAQDLRGSQVADARKKRQARQKRQEKTIFKKPELKSRMEMVKIKNKDQAPMENIFSNDTPPEDYTFVPFGVSEVTERCKELCSKQHRRGFRVLARPTRNVHTNPNTVAYHSSRIGHYFPDDIVDDACMWHGYSITEDRNIVRPHDPLHIQPMARLLESHAQRIGKGRKLNMVEEKEQVRAAIAELFPSIPTADAEAIVSHAFAQGKKTVGNADLPLDRKVQLAVGAHIRHRYTDYDWLLNTLKVPRAVARAEIEPYTLDKIKMWRGEDEKSIEEGYKEEFREVILLDDDDELDDTVQSDRYIFDQEERRMPTASLQPVYQVGAERINTRPIDTGRPRTYVVQQSSRAPLGLSSKPAYPPTRYVGPADYLGPASSTSYPSLEQSERRYDPMFPPERHAPVPLPIPRRQDQVLQATIGGQVFKLQRVDTGRVQEPVQYLNAVPSVEPKGSNSSY